MMLVFFVCNNSAEDYSLVKEQNTIDSLKLKSSGNEPSDYD